jgi:hypothetical protein
LKNCDKNFASPKALSNHIRSCTAKNNNSVKENNTLSDETSSDTNITKKKGRPKNKIVEVTL